MYISHVECTNQLYLYRAANEKRLKLINVLITYPNMLTNFQVLHEFPNLKTVSANLISTCNSRQLYKVSFLNVLNCQWCSSLKHNFQRMLLHFRFHSACSKKRLIYLKISSSLTFNQNIQMY